MLRPLPGMGGCAVVVQDARPDDVIYAASEANRAQRMAEGPKIASRYGSGCHIVRDFCGHAYEGAPDASPAAS